MSTKIETREAAQKLLDSYDTFLFDCDGVLWSGAHLLPNVPETLQLLRDAGKKVLFVTNNSTKSRRQYAKKFEGFGIAVKVDEIFCSSYSSAVYLKKVVNFPADKKVLIVGEEGLEDELEQAGIAYVGGTDESLRTASMDNLEAIGRDESIGCVLAGLDRFINYRKLAYAQAQLKDKDVLFYATNIDSTFPNGDRLLPGAGTVVQAIATASGRQPKESLGKPSHAMMDAIKAVAHFDPARTVMVGDRLNTDMVFGEEGGLGTLMVLTGIDTEETIKNNPPVQPKYYMDFIGKLHELLK